MNNGNIPDLGKLSDPVGTVLSDARQAMPEGTQRCFVVWENPDGSVSWSGNVPLQLEHFMASLVMGHALAQALTPP